MADVSQLSIGDQTYNIKDTSARSDIASLLARVVAIENQMPAYNNSIILDSNYGTASNSQQEGGASNE